MNRSDYLTCTAIIRNQREREISGGYGWPGKALKDTAETLYPNLVSEMGWSIPWLYLPAEFANVSPEIMAAALEDNEELSLMELIGIARYLALPVGYLTAPRMSFVDPATNKGKARRRALADLLKQAYGLDFMQRRVERVLSALDEGKTITYASYRWALTELRDAINKYLRGQNTPRSIRRKARA